MFECFHCGNKSVIWDSDFDYEDYGEDGEGIIHECHCTSCGARITYMVDLSEPVEKQETVKRIFHPGCRLFECANCGEVVSGIDAYCRSCGRKFGEDDDDGTDSVQ